MGKKVDPRLREFRLLAPSGCGRGGEFTQPGDPSLAQPSSCVAPDVVRGKSNKCRKEHTNSARACERGREVGGGIPQEGESRLTDKTDRPIAARRADAVPMMTYYFLLYQP